jgi:hypothetical protein
VAPLARAARRTGIRAHALADRGAPGSDLDVGRSNLGILAFLLAIAALVHQATKLTLVASLPATLTSGSAILLLAKPEWSPALLLFAASQLWMLVGQDPPSIDNHWLVVGIVNVGLLSSAASAAWRSQGVPWRTVELEPFALPLVRGCVLILYALSVLHKLNPAFLDSSGSCVTELYGVLARRFPIPNSAWLHELAINGTLVTEMAIPLLLATRRLRTAGLLLGILFHYVLGLVGFYNFSMTMVALYAAFLPPGFGAELARQSAARQRRRVLRWAVSISITWGLIFLAVMAALAVRGVAHEPRWLAYGSAYAWWALYAPLLVVGYVGVTGRATPSRHPEPGVLAPRRPWHAVTVLLMLLNGLAPYLGLKTEAAFSMYSNLRTEGPYWNHLLLPSSLRFAGYQDDLVSIEASAAPELGWHRQRGEQIVGLEFERLVRRLCRDRREPLAIEYTRNGERRSLADACETPPRTVHRMAWVDRLLVFRPVTAACRH